MNEQLVVKNFGPIKDATVDFKRVTVFIGPTGGGKSTLAKLAAVFRQFSSFLSKEEGLRRRMNSLGIENYFSETSSIEWLAFPARMRFENGNWTVGFHNVVRTEQQKAQQLIYELQKEINSLKELVEKNGRPSDFDNQVADIEGKRLIVEDFIKNHAAPKQPQYLPAERILLAILGDNWPDLISEKSSLPSALLLFAKGFLNARKEIEHLPLVGIDAHYQHSEDRDRIVLGNGKTLMLSETASGIQSVTPLLVLLEHLSRNTEQAQSFIIEEPELNLYPTAQQGLLNWLVEKCTKGENDLTITTHSPYVLSALNLALYANKVATQFPHQSKKVAKLIPEKCWLKAEEFSAYFVAKGTAKSIFNTKTGLLSESQLDEVSGEFADIFDRLTDLRVPEKKTPAKAKSAKK